MSSPFYNAIKGTTAGTPGTGAFTPNTAASGFLAWSTVPTGWIGLVRYEDGSDWELQYSYWNGTTLSRSATTQFVASSTGSGLTLTSAATAAMVVDAGAVMPHLGAASWRGYQPIPANLHTTVGLPAVTVTGTFGAASVAATNYLTEQARAQVTSNTTANALAGISNGTITAVYSTTAGRGGFEFCALFGVTQLPVGPRLFVGMSTAIISTTEPSALVQNFAIFGKDSTDTNIHLMTNDGSGSGGKTDTGIALVVNGWYEARIWAEPGGGKIYGLLVRRDTGDIWFGSTTSQLPTANSLLNQYCLGGLSGTTGTAIVMQCGHFLVRSGI